MKHIVRGIHYRTREFIELEINEGKICSIKSLTERINEDTPIIGPGLVDLQINGFKGYDFNTLPLTIQQVKEITEALWSEGVTTYFPTIITNSDEAIEEALTVISEACSSYPLVEKTIAGIHVEGPFISPEDGPRGAHSKNYVKAPNWEVFARWQEAAGGRIKIVTISPEWTGSVEFIKKCVQSGVTVSIGHTAATPEQIREASSAGATMSTHLGNGAHLMIPRHPNYIWEQLATDELTTCLIADGFHLPNSFLKVAMKAKGENVMLVSDAVYLSGLAPGKYETHIGGKVVLTPEGKLHTADNPKILAGSAQMLKHGIGHLVKSKLASLDLAWEMSSIRPASFMDLPSKVGLVECASADIVIFSCQENNITIHTTYKDGQIVFDKNAINIK